MFVISICINYCFNFYLFVFITIIISQLGIIIEKRHRTKISLHKKSIIIIIIIILKSGLAALNNMSEMVTKPKFRGRMIL